LSLSVQCFRPGLKFPVNRIHGVDDNAMRQGTTIGVHMDKGQETVEHPLVVVTENNIHMCRQAALTGENNLTLKAENMTRPYRLGENHPVDVYANDSLRGGQAGRSDKTGFHEPFGALPANSVP